ncbi:outer membrane protein assembly factor BamA [Pelagibacterales bacterium SAG-MED34]|nr:outer membrane protein assembly factor BamA [Pelagibacterales bacterium SAG-MED34]
MIENLKKLLNLVNLILITLLLSFSTLKAEIYKEIKVEGNERLSVETIIMFSGLNLSYDVTVNDLNTSIKKLYKTNYFKDIKITQKNKILTIKIIENPIIQSIKINGIKNKTILNKLEELTKKSEKYPFLKNNILNQNNLLLNTVRGTGYYFAELDTKIIDNQNNSVDILYNFILGERAIIKKINFQGDKVFSDTKLRNIIRSEEGKFWKFITSNKYLDELKIKQDEKRLKKYYQKKGYYNVNVKASYAKNINNEFFELNFNIESGSKFFFNNISIEINDNFDEENFIRINNKIKKLKGKQYSSQIINDILEDIDQILLSKEFLFLNTNYDLSITEKNKINLKFKFQDLEKLYVERINILGNFITEEKVIRNSLIVDEGDAFNKMLLDKSINSIKSRGIFKSVGTEIKTSKMDNQKKVIDILVEEMPTGEIYAGAGTGTSGATITAGVQEKNYLGKGVKLGTNILISEDELKGKFSVVNPNFKNTDRSLNTTLESTSSDFINTGGFKTSRTGFSIGTGFEQYSDLYVNLDISAYYEKLETSSTASDHKKKQEGDYLENLFTYNVKMNKLDQNYQPSQGYMVSFNQELPIYSDDLSIGNTINLSKYHSVSDNLILSGKLFLKSVNSIDDDVRVSRRIYIPSKNLRGFEPGKIGPKDGTEYVGGNFGSALNLNSTIPNVINGFENIDLNFFLDAATLREVDYDSSLESSKIRSSTGIAVNWFTVIGPLSFSYAIPLSKEKTDQTESFRFRIGTSF